MGRSKRDFSIMYETNFFEGAMSSDSGGGASGIDFIFFLLI